MVTSTTIMEKKLARLRNEHIFIVITKTNCSWVKFGLFQKRNRKAPDRSRNFWNDKNCRKSGRALSKVNLKNVIHDVRCILEYVWRHSRQRSLKVLFRKSFSNLLSYLLLVLWCHCSLILPILFSDKGYSSLKIIKISESHLPIMTTT